MRYLLPWFWPDVVTLIHDVQLSNRYHRFGMIVVLGPARTAVRILRRRCRVHRTRQARRLCGRTLYVSINMECLPADFCQITERKLVLDASGYVCTNERRPGRAGD